MATCALPRLCVCSLGGRGEKQRGSEGRGGTIGGYFINSLGEMKVEKKRNEREGRGTKGREGGKGKYEREGRGHSLGEEDSSDNPKSDFKNSLIT